MSITTLNFCPNTSYTIAATTTTGNTALTQPAAVEGGAGNNNGYSTIVVYNAANKVAFLSPGRSSQTATANSIYQIAPGAIMSFDLPFPPTNLGAILEAGATSGNLYVMLGSGT